jgi:predicted Zn-ribbon and HTH transcriptional regulator
MGPTKEDDPELTEESEDDSNEGDRAVKALTISWAICKSCGGKHPQGSACPNCKKVRSL